MKTNGIEFHPVAGIFDLMEGGAYAELVADVRKNGLRLPIWLHDNMIVDGRNRYRACIDAQIEPRFQKWDGVGKLCDFVWSLNGPRRHLTVGQKAIAAARMATLAEGRPAKTPSADGVSQAQAAKIVGVGEASVVRASRVLRSGIPELVKAVECGVIGLEPAAIIASKPNREQLEIVNRAKQPKEKRVPSARVSSGGTDTILEMIEGIREVLSKPSIRVSIFDIKSRVELLYKAYLKQHGLRAEKE